MNYLYVGVGSAVGGIARFAIGGWLQRQMVARIAERAGASVFPIGTLFVNVTGSFLLGVLLVVIARQGTTGETTRLLLAVGLCGGYTTFSTFSAETIGLLEQGGTALALLNVGATLALALFATFAGIVLTRLLFVAPPL